MPKLAFRLALLLTTLAGGANTCFAPKVEAQEVQFYVGVDTAGVGLVGPQIYQTWIMARRGENGPPVSMVLASFDCLKRVVRREAHMVFAATPDSLRISGAVVADTTAWVPFADPRIDDLVCAIGRKKYKPESQYKQS